MSTASAYINKLRVETTAKNNKVEYPGRVAKNIESLAPSCPSNPNFGILNYENTLAKCNRYNVSICPQVEPPIVDCNSEGYSQGFRRTTRQSGTNPVFNPALQANPFNSGSWPAVVSTTNIIGSANIVPPGITSDFFWETRFYIIPPSVPYTFIFKIDADDAVAIRNEDTSTVVVNRWSQAAPPGFGGPFVYSDTITLTECINEFLMVSANALPPNNNYVLSIVAITPPPGPPPYTQIQLDAQPAFQIYPYCYLV